MLISNMHPNEKQAFIRKPVFATVQHGSSKSLTNEYVKQDCFYLTAPANFYNFKKQLCAHLMEFDTSGKRFLYKSPI